MKRQFIIHPGELVKFLQYIKAYGVEPATEFKYIHEKITYDSEGDVSNRTGSNFLVDITFRDGLDFVRFHNIFVIMFSISKPIVFVDDDLK